MLRFRPVFVVLGLFLMAMGALMLLPALADYIADNRDWVVFVASSGVTSFAGGLLLLGSRGPMRGLGPREGFLLTALAWVVLSGFGALPFLFTGIGLDYADAFFETMSGLTTTGATVLIDLPTLPPGILLWRSLLQGIGGMGIVVMAVALLPMLRIGGMQLFKTESSETGEKALPRSTQVAAAVLLVYMILLLACLLVYRALGMSGFDAINHAFTTISTGGFSTYDNSFAAFKSPAIEWSATLFMLVSGMPFLLLYQFARLGRPRLLLDSQVLLYLLNVAAAVGAVAIYLYANSPREIGESLRLAAFNVVSVITTTGFVSADYSQWGPFPVMLFAIITFVGGCTGSTSGGMKIFRFDVMIAALRQLCNRMIEPRSVSVVTYRGQSLTRELVSSVGVFLFLYFFFVNIISAGLMAMGLDFTTAFTGAATAVGNVGPGLGEVIGPAGTFRPLPDGAKWLLSFGMLLGRLEIITILILFTPRFWKG